MDDVRLARSESEVGADANFQGMVDFGTAGGTIVGAGIDSAVAKFTIQVDAWAELVVAGQREPVLLILACRRRVILIEMRVFDAQRPQIDGVAGADRGDPAIDVG